MGTGHAGREPAPAHTRIERRRREVQCASNTAVAAATFRLSTAPLPGIDRRRSQAVASAGSMPSPSAPMM